MMRETNNYGTSLWAWSLNDNDIDGDKQQYFEMYAYDDDNAYDTYRIVKLSSRWSTFDDKVRSINMGPLV